MLYLSRLLYISSREAPVHWYSGRHFFTKRASLSATLLPLIIVIEFKPFIIQNVIYPLHNMRVGLAPGQFFELR